LRGAIVIRLVRKDNVTYDDFTYPEDVKHIVEVMRQAGFFIKPVDAHWAWCMCSDERCASWISLPDDDANIVSIIMDYMREHD
jgi:hypothetical protein